MAVVARVATIVLSAAAGAGTRTFQATAAVKDTPAGSSVNIVVTQTTSGVSPPLVPDTYVLRCRIDNDATNVRTFTLLSGSGSQAVDFFLTIDGQSGTSPRVGTVRLRLEAVRTSGTAVDNYNVNSDDTTGQVLPAGWSVTQRDQGYIRGSTTAVVSTSNASFGGAESALYAYPDTVFHRTVLGAALFKAYFLDATISGASLGSPVGVSATQTFDATFSTFITNRFSIASQVQTASVSSPNAGLATGEAVVPLTVTTDSMTIDPRLTTTHLLQVNDSAFGTPPLSLDQSSRLTSDLGFLSVRFTNARGEGKNGLQAIVKNWDVNELTGSEVGPVNLASGATDTNGGQAGWMESASSQLPIAWDEGLPGGDWTVKVILETANAIGLEIGNTRTVSLLALDLDLFVFAGGGNATDETGHDHWHPGDPLLVGAAVLDLGTGSLIPMDGAEIVLARLNPNNGQGEYLDLSGVWQSITTTPAVRHTLTETVPGISRVYSKLFATTGATWNTRDIFVCGIMTRGGTPYKAMAIIPVLQGGTNEHDGYALDAMGLALSGILSQK